MSNDCDEAESILPDTPFILNIKEEPIVDELDVQDDLMDNGYENDTLYVISNGDCEEPVTSNILTNLGLSERYHENSETIRATEKDSLPLTVGFEPIVKVENPEEEDESLDDKMYISGQVSSI